MTEPGEPKYSAPTPDPPGEAGPAGAGQQPALDQLLKLGRELISQLSYYVRARADQLKLSVRQFLVFGAMGVLALVVGAVIVATAAWLLVNGIAGGLAALFGGRVWLGNLGAGVLVLAGIAGGAWYGIEELRRGSQRDTVQRYQKLQAEHREKFGRDLTDE